MRRSPSAFGVVFGVFQGGGYVVLYGGTPYSDGAQAGGVGGGQNVNCCPPPSPPFTACARPLYADALVARCRCGCLF